MRIDIEYLQEKAAFFETHPKASDRRKWLIQQNELNYGNLKLYLKIRRLDKFLVRHKLPKYLDVVKWVFIDFLRGKTARFSGIYSYVGLPGEGKTLSMVAHIERVKKQFGKDVLVATNFNYKGEDARIEHWLDIIKFATRAKKEGKRCIIAMDEIHITFDSADWQHFPAEMLSLISFNRKYNLQFICSSQDYDRVPKKIRRICEYVVICENVLKTDRYFKNYYYQKSSYDSVFDGQLKKADFIRDFVADDWLYSRYDTKQLVEKLTRSAQEEKDMKQQAFDILFNSHHDDDKVGEAVGA